jgi:hypothetical protein
LNRGEISSVGERQAGLSAHRLDDRDKTGRTPDLWTPSDGRCQKSAAGAFGLKGENRMRHANPASVWTRFSVLPLLAGSIWSRNDRLALLDSARALIRPAIRQPLPFRPPRSTKNWASKAVFGERIWVERDRSELPDQFKTSASAPSCAPSYWSLRLLLLKVGPWSIRLTFYWRC